MTDEVKDGPLEGENRPLCDYRTKDDQCCTKQAVERIKGRNLCSTHRRFGNTMEPAKGSASAQAQDKPADDPAKSQQIVTENAATEFANAQKPPADGAFNKNAFYQRIRELCDDVEMKMNRFDKGKSLASHLQAARLTLLDEMTGPPAPDNQGEIPLDDGK